MNDGIFISADILAIDTPNKNGRIYPREVVEKALAEVKFPMMGTIGMPDDTQIDLMNVSHMVTEMKIDENGHVIGTVKVLNTPKGQELARMIADDVAKDKVAFRSAGVGKIDEKGIVSDYRFICVSVVPKDTAS